jgi:hypothetical protein
MSYNEAETRLFLIDPVLREKGCNEPQWLNIKWLNEDNNAELR